MSTEVLPVIHRRAPDQPAQPSEASLTWRASLNLVQSMLDYSAKLAVGLLVIPILVGNLGRAVFGVWEMLGRLMGYLESTDGRPTQALRLVISNRQSHDDPVEKRRWVGSAVAVWICFLPLWIAAGALVIWLAPRITKVDPALSGTVRLACGVMMAGVLLAGLTSMPESVLRGMNLGYKRMGLQASLSFLGGVMLVSAVYLGTGLIGLAAAGVTLILCTGLCFLLLVRRQVPWFGIERPTRSQVNALARMSLWIALGDAVSKLLLASDVLVLGMVVSPTVVTTYVLTGYASLLAVNLHALAADSVIPGLAGIIGRQNYARAASIRRELLALTVVFISAAGAAVLLGNRSFVHLWVGGENYAGVETNFLLVVIAVQTAFIRCDAYILDSALQPGWRVRVSTLAALLALGLSVLLTRYWGMVGLCLGILAGRAIQSVWYPLLVSRYLRNTPGLSSRWLTRPLGSMLLLFGIAGWAGDHIRLASWAAFGIAMVLTAGLAAAVTMGLGLPAELRALVKSRALELQARLFPDPRTGGTL